VSASNGVETAAREPAARSDARTGKVRRIGAPEDETVDSLLLVKQSGRQTESLQHPAYLPVFAGY
jgi:hypothetical protein